MASGCFIPLGALTRIMLVISFAGGGGGGCCCRYANLIVEEIKNLISNLSFSLACVQSFGVYVSKMFPDLFGRSAKRKQPLVAHWSADLPLQFIIFLLLLLLSYVMSLNVFIQ